jgi:hypothetical protein
MSSAVPLTRTLPAFLRRELAAQRRNSVRLFVARVAAVPDAAHVTITWGGAETIVPRLASYTTAAVGDRAYCLATGSLVIAIGEAA